MSPTELKMQHTIHLEGKAGYRVHIRPYVPKVLWVAFSIPSGLLLLVNQLRYKYVNNNIIDPLSSNNILVVSIDINSFSCILRNLIVI
jgi:hypothetical protein